MQPRPIAETSGPDFPSLRRSVTIVPLIDLSLSESKLIAAPAVDHNGGPWFGYNLSSASVARERQRRDGADQWPRPWLRVADQHGSGPTAGVVAAVLASGGSAVGGRGAVPG